MIDPAWSMISRAAYSLRVAAVLENSSFFKRTARCQSRTAVTLEITSAHPEASSRNGAWTMTSVSAMIPIGTAASMLVVRSRPCSEARGEEIPSCAADVGTLTNGMRSRWATTFVMSILLPPPAAIRKRAPIARTSDSTRATSASVASLAMITGASNPTLVRISAARLPASSAVFGPVITAPESRKSNCRQVGAQLVQDPVSRQDHPGKHHPARLSER